MIKTAVDTGTEEEPSISVFLNLLDSPSRLYTFKNFCPATVQVYSKLGWGRGKRETLFKRKFFLQFVQSALACYAQKT